MDRPAVLRRQRFAGRGEEQHRPVHRGRHPGREDQRRDVGSPNYSGGGYWDLATCQANMTDIETPTWDHQVLPVERDANLSQAAGWVSAMRTIVGI